MINKLSIRNFKSIKEMDIDCARVNLFIGEPNTGKSNILEALGLLSWCGCEGASLNDFVRFQYTSNLFYDNLTNQIVDVNIATENMLINIDLRVEPGSSVYTVYSGQQEKDKPLFTVDLSQQTDLSNEGFGESLGKRISLHPIQAILVGKSNPKWLIFDQQRMYATRKRDDLLDVYECAQKSGTLDKFGKTNNLGIQPNLNFIKFYRYKQLEGDKFPDKSLSTLVYPYGSNMLTLISTTEKHRETIASFFRDFGFKPSIRPHEDSIEFEKEAKNVNINYPYLLASDTLRRMIFYNIAIDSNKDSTLIFEEPETHTFANYTKRLGEKIAFNKENQYFIVTHNPYLFLSILEKTAENEAKVFITYYKNYQTKVKVASEKEIAKLMKYDPFFNLDMLIPKK
ncbi:MAG: AAA family ATPase [Candidatus Poribacteria bacterium]